MPKRPRQAHIPQQAKKRKVRRTPVSEEIYPAPIPNVAGLGAQAPAGPISMPPASGSAGHRRFEARTVAVRSAGQLPTFERSYLVNELRQIGLTAAGLLAFIIVLTVLLR